MVRWLDRLAVAAALVPLVVFAVRAIGEGTYPVFDDALIALRIHDVVSTHPPTVGAGTQFGLISIEAGANHPGPLPFVLLAPVYALSGFRPEGLIIALTAYHAAFVVLVAHLARRIGGVRLVVVAMAAVLLVERTLGDEVFTSPWNPYLALLPFLAFLFAVWATLGERTDGALAWLVLTGSVAVQAQATFAAAVGLLGGVAAVVAVVRVVQHRRRHDPVAWGPLAGAAAVGLVAWSLPLLQEVTAEDGNLSRLVRWTLGDSGSGTSVGLARGSEMVAHVIGRVPPPVVDLGQTRDDVLSGAPGPVTWAVAAAVVALLVGVVARRRRAPQLAIGAGVALATVGIGVVVAARATPDAAVTPYQLASLWIAAAFALAVLAAAALDLALGRWPVASWPSLAVRVGAVAAPVVLAVLAVAALPDRGDLVIEVQEERYRPTVDALLAAVEPDDGPYLVSCTGSARLSLCGTVILALEADGVGVVADPGTTSLYGPDVGWRLAGPDDRLPTLVVGSGPWLVPPGPDAELVAASVFDGFAPVAPPAGSVTTPEEQDVIEVAAAALARADVEVARDDVEALREARGVDRLTLGVDGGWFRGRTAEEWQQAIDDDPVRFVGAGGLAVLDEAGLLADHPEMASHVEALDAFPDRDAVWLLPSGPPRGDGR